MGGNRQQAAQKRQGRNVAKAKARRHQQTKSSVLPVQRDPLAAMKIGPETFSDADMVFWVCHGINHILSDYTEGTWTPMFPGIYPEEGGVLPDPEDVPGLIMERYNTNVTAWPHEAKAALAWAVQDRNVVYVYYREAIRRLSAAHGGDANIEGMARAPHNPLVWALFDYMKNKVLNRKVTPHA